MERGALIKRKNGGNALTLECAQSSSAVQALDRLESGGHNRADRCGDMADIKDGIRQINEMVAEIYKKSGVGEHAANIYTHDAFYEYANEIKQYTLRTVEYKASEVEKQLNNISRTLKREREEYSLQGGLRAITFWMTPALLILQSVLLIMLLIE